MTIDLAIAFDEHCDDERPVAEVLGGKGAALRTMTELSLPVPPGFTFSTDACRRFLADGWVDEFDEALHRQLDRLEAATGRRLGDPHRPLLVSVRSGAAESMPGMMDTVLDVGITDTVAAALTAATGDPAFGADTHRRSLVSYASVVCSAATELVRAAHDAPTVEAARSLLEDAGCDHPEDPREQIAEAIRAVFASWNSRRAIDYRRRERIGHDGGTAATVQAMVFGNLDDASGTGVAFTRDPSTGEAVLMGDFLVRAQGEDVVAGTHVTEPLRAMQARWPEVHDELVRIADILETHWQDMVDIEFTVESGQLFMLQARRGKRSPIATFQIAHDLALDPAFRVSRAEAVDRCRHLFGDPPRVGAEDDRDAPALAEGLPASPGRAVGRLCLDVDEAVSLAEEGVDVVLVRRETSPADVHGMGASVGLVTLLGGLVSHAAVVARSWGIPAVVGAGSLTIEPDGIRGPGGRVAVGELLTVDGATGRVLIGVHADRGTVPPVVDTVMGWASTTDAEPDAERGPTTVPLDGPAGDRLAPAGRSGRDDVDVDFVVLHALRIKGAAGIDAVAAIAGVDADSARACLDQQLSEGRVRYLEARDLWGLLPAGQEAWEKARAAALAAIDVSRLPYEPFLRLNDSFKAVCTDWQVRDGQPNDHGDVDYDASIIDRVSAIHDEVEPLIEEMGTVLARLGSYAPRLGAALGRLRDGDQKALTGVLCDSYHDIWMELHEDLILLQGIDRAAEGST